MMARFSGTILIETDVGALPIFRTFGLSISDHRMKGYLDHSQKMDGDPRRACREKHCFGQNMEGCGEIALALKEFPEAIFAVNDGVAIGAMAVIKDAGFKIPDDMFDRRIDDEPIVLFYSVTFFGMAASL